MPMLKLLGSSRRWCGSIRGFCGSVAEDPIHRRAAESARQSSALLLRASKRLFGSSSRKRREEELNQELNERYTEWYLRQMVSKVQAAEDSQNQYKHFSGATSTPASPPRKHEDVGSEQTRWELLEQQIRRDSTFPSAARLARKGQMIADSSDTAANEHSLSAEAGDAIGALRGQKFRAERNEGRETSETTSQWVEESFFRDETDEKLRAIIGQDNRNNGCLSSHWETLFEEADKESGKEASFAKRKKLQMSCSSSDSPVDATAGHALPQRRPQSKEEMRGFLTASPSSTSTENFGCGEETSAFDRSAFSSCNFREEEATEGRRDVGDAFESRRRTPLYQDLLHEEAQTVQSLYQQKCDMDRRVRWLKMRGLPDPQKEAAAQRRAVEDARVSDLEKGGGGDMRRVASGAGDEGEGTRFAHPRRFLEQEEEREAVGKVAKLIKRGEHIEAVSHLRAKLREERRQRSRELRRQTPEAAGPLLDPIRYHVERRRDRIGVMIKTHLEEFLTWNTASMLHDVLQGAALSIHHVEMRTSRSAVKVFYTVATNHDRQQLQRKLDLAAPKFRHRLAQKLELGHTPPIQFVPFEGPEVMDKRRLFQLSQTVDSQDAAQLTQQSWEKAMNGIG